MPAGGPKKIVPVLGFLGLIFSPAWKPEALIRQLSECFGPLGMTSSVFDFEFTSYYQTEMGPGLSRLFCAMPRLVPADALLQVKEKARRLEAGLSREGRRTVNIDPGYLDAFKVVLLSDKYSGRKIYLGQGCYADVTLRFSSGTWQAVERAFPDFCDSRYGGYFLGLRAAYLDEMRHG